MDPIGFLKGILRVIPSSKKMLKTIKKRMQEQGNDGTPLEENILRELALIKILIDIKITILSTSESPHFKVI